MKNLFNLYSENTRPEISESRIVPALARDTSRREWLTLAGSLAGLAVMGGIASAQDGAQPNPPAPTSSQATPGASVVPQTDGNPNNPATVIEKAAKKVSQGDIDILNFALGLEYLEADFYASIVAAHQAKAYLPQRVFEAAQKLAADEAAHVTAITQLLQAAGATPVAKPSFKYPANVYLAPLAFLNTAVNFEITGVGAYLGAAPLVKSVDALRFAASIYGIEARHTGLLRWLNGQPVAGTDIEPALTVAQATERVKPYIVG